MRCRSRATPQRIVGIHELAQLNKADPHPHPLEVFWLHDHPPVAARLALADEPGVGGAAERRAPTDP